jgi:DNA-binding PadR family transcriptional regulator
VLGIGDDRVWDGRAAVNISKELVAASATPIVLAILHASDSYGYAIIQKVREVSEARLTWTDGMLYPVLHRLEEAGFVVSRWEGAETGRRRKYYRLTDTGMVELARLREQWLVVHHSLERLAGATDPGEKDV